MLLILLSAHASMSNDQQLLITILIGIIIGVLITARGHTHYDSTPKVFLYSLVVEATLVVIISFVSLAWSIGVFYGAVFGTIFSLGINHFSKNR